MEQHLFVLLLFTGVLPLVLSAPPYYCLIQKEKSWDDARAYCRLRYTDLAIISSNEDMTKLQQEAQVHRFSASAWIGLHTNFNRWYWSFNNESLGSYTAWNYGYPDNGIGNDQCVSSGSGRWFDAPCNWPYSFVCFNGTETGVDQYIYISEIKTWHEALRYCRQHYTDLAGIRNATENTVVTTLSSGKLIWLGLRRDPWKWSDQTTDISAIRWSNGDRDDYLLNKSCGFLSNGVADAAECSDIKPFFCYSEEFPDHQRIIRVKVSSREDVNDPAVTAAILEKIKQKLKDQGLSANSIVKWREQPDGLVFQKQENHLL